MTPPIGLALYESRQAGLDGTVAQNEQRRARAVQLLQVFAVALMVFPSDAVIRAIGGAGAMASLVAMSAFAVWVAATIRGTYDPLQRRHPIRVAIVVLWFVSLAAYFVMNLGERSGVEIRSADRWLMQLAGTTGVAFVAAEWLASLDDIKRVLRALLWGGSFCGVVASLQFWLGIDLALYLRMVPGFSVNGENVGIATRGALNRVTGTAIHPIELGVVAGMLLPLAIYMAMYDLERPPRKRWAPVVLIGLAIPTSVSRSAIVAVVLALGFLIVLLPAPQRVTSLAALPVAVAGAFMAAPGLISTLSSFFFAGTADQSIATRVDDYPFVERMVSMAPWFGRGGGTFLPVDAFQILDNQYLKTAIELGLVGVVGLSIYFVLPLVAALVARRCSTDRDLRTLSGALAGSAVSAAVCSVTFDSLSFPMFTGVHSLVIGLAGACWLLMKEERGARARAAATANETPGVAS